MWIVTRAACAGGCKRHTPCRTCLTIYNKEEELHMNQFTKAVKSLAAKNNETS